MGPLGVRRTSERGQGPSQQITNFCKSVSHKILLLVNFHFPTKKKIYCLKIFLFLPSILLIIDTIYYVRIILASSLQGEIYLVITYIAC